MGRCGVPEFRVGIAKLLVLGLHLIHRLLGRELCRCRCRDACRSIRLPVVVSRRQLGIDGHGGLRYAGCWRICVVRRRGVLLELAAPAPAAAAAETFDRFFRSAQTETYGDQCDESDQAEAAAEPGSETNFCAQGHFA